MSRMVTALTNGAARSMCDSIHVRSGTAYVFKRDREPMTVLVRSELEIFQTAGRIEEDGHQADPVTPDVPIPPYTEVTQAAEPPAPADKASPGPGSEPPD